MKLNSYTLSEKRTPFFSAFFLFLFILPVWNGHIVSAQTSGNPQVTAIESKASDFDVSKRKISQYKSELLSLENAWKEKMQKLRQELAALAEERDKLLTDMKVGAKCSQCGKYKSEFEKEGKSFQQHLGEVKGVAIPATTEELEKTRTAYAEKTAYKKVQIQHLEKGDNAVMQKQNEIAKLESQNKEICKDIAALSKKYETVVLTEAKSNHTNWADGLLTSVTNILIADDKITIYKSRISRLEASFLRESEQLKAQLKKENTEAQQDKQALIEVYAKQAITIQTERSAFLSEKETALKELRQRKNDTEKMLTDIQTKDSTKARLKNNIEELSTLISSLDKTIIDYKSTAQKKITSIDTDTRNLKTQIASLAAGLSKQQNAEVAKLKLSYDQKKADATQAVAKAVTELAGAKKTYASNSEQARQRHQSYLDLVSQETARIVTASQRTACPVYNEAQFKVTNNWNQAFSCVNALSTLAKPYSTNVFNSYCQGKSMPAYLAAYKGFLTGLDSEDRNAIKSNSNAAWFDLMML